MEARKYTITLVDTGTNESHTYRGIVVGSGIKELTTNLINYYVDDFHVLETLTFDWIDGENRVFEDGEI